MNTNALKRLSVALWNDLFHRELSSEYHALQRRLAEFLELHA